MLVLKNESDFNVVNEISNKAIQEIDEKNLSFYDVELFVNCKVKSTLLFVAYTPEFIY